MAGMSEWKRLLNEKKFNPDFVQNWPGTPDRISKFPSVVWLGAGRSAVVIGPRHLLVSPHSDSLVGAEVRTSAETTTGHSMQSLMVFVSSQKKWDRADIAVLRTNDVIAAEIAELGAVSSADREIVTVGYGQSLGRQYQTLRIASITCQEADAGTRYGFQPSEPHLVCDDCNAGVCAYDSGGAAFVKRGSSWTLVGVTTAGLAGTRAAELANSCPAPYSSRCGFGGIFARVDGDAGEWILQTVADMG